MQPPATPHSNPEPHSHQEIGQHFGLIHFHEYSPGSAFFLPHGTRIYNRLMEFLRKEYRKRGFDEVITPNLFHCELWKKSGHWEKYRKNMFTLCIQDHDATENGDENEDENGDENGDEEKEHDHAFKAMNCPGHCLIFDSKPRSYRELPLRLADFGVLHRNEFSGALRGLTRVRKFCQDDAHIFCREDQIETEIEKCIDFVKYVYQIFRFPAVNGEQNFHVALSTRPDQYIGSIDTWNHAEKVLADVLTKLHIEYTVNPGDAAFYGPKIDIHIGDALGRKHQCATIQLDFNLPERFKLEYVTSVPGVSQRPVIIHRAIFGSFERFLAILMEHTQGQWPLWLSPRQIMVIPIKPKHLPYAKEVHRRFLDADFYVDIDDSDDTLEKRIVNAEQLAYNYIIVIGAREEKDKTVSIRNRKREQAVFSLDDCVKRLQEEVSVFL